MRMSMDRRPWRPLGLLLTLLLLACAEGDAGADGDAPSGEAAPGMESATGATGIEDAASQTWAPGPPLARPPAARTPTPSSLPEDVSGGDEQELDVSDLGYDFGSPDAPIRIIEFSDFGCGYCRKFHVETYPTLREEYVETGKVQWKYVPYILGMFGPNAVDAALVGECAGEQGEFVAMREELFEHQSEWKGADGPRELFESYARAVDLDMDRFVSCMTEMRPQERIVAGSNLGRQLGVRGTPTFFIPGVTVIPGALPVETFRLVLDQVLAAVDSAQAAGGGGSGPE